MMSDTAESLIKKFEEQNKSIAIAYGGDGTLLSKARAKNFKKAIAPIRNYGLCQKHANILNDFLGTGKADASFKITVQPLIRCQVGGLDWSEVAMSELTLKNLDLTSCLRFDLKVNGRLYMENVMADGLIAATPLGSHAYFKSVARLIFTEGIGIGFIAPTYGINNLVIRQQDKAEVIFRRDFDVQLTFDKLVKEVKVKAGQSVTIESACQNMSVVGYDAFMCPECRKLRNSTMVNDQYLG